MIFVGISWIMEGVHRICGVHRIWREYVRYLGEYISFQRGY